MQYDHPTIHVQSPAPGHYAITGHAPRSALTDAGHIVPPATTYIPPEIPDALLLAIVEDRQQARTQTPAASAEPAESIPSTASISSLPSSTRGSTGRLAKTHRKGAAK